MALQLQPSAFVTTMTALQSMHTYRYYIIVLLLNILHIISHFKLVSSWSTSTYQWHRHRCRCIMSTSSCASSSSSDGSLLLSTMHRIALVDNNDDDGAQSSSKLIKLILASQSPRRREILDMIGLRNRYIVQPSPLDEEKLQIELASQNDITPTVYARTLAERKAHAMAVTLLDNEGVTLVIGSDTIVDLDGSIMEKPKDEEDAYNMLSRLSGNWHQVHTGVAVYGTGLHKGEEESLLFSFTETSKVQFATLSHEDIQSYIATKEPMDKAGERFCLFCRCVSSLLSSSTQYLSSKYCIFIYDMHLVTYCR